MTPFVSSSVEKGPKPADLLETIARCYLESLGHCLILILTSPHITQHKNVFTLGNFSYNATIYIVSRNQFKIEVLFSGIDQIYIN